VADKAYGLAYGGVGGSVVVDAAVPVQPEMGQSAKFGEAALNMTPTKEKDELSPVQSKLMFLPLGDIKKRLAKHKVQVPADITEKAELVALLEKAEENEEASPSPQRPVALLARMVAVSPASPSDHSPTKADTPMGCTPMTSPNGALSGGSVGSTPIFPASPLATASPPTAASASKHDRTPVASPTPMSIATPRDCSAAKADVPEDVEDAATNAKEPREMVSGDPVPTVEGKMAAAEPEVVVFESIFMDLSIGDIKKRIRMNKVQVPEELTEKAALVALLEKVDPDAREEADEARRAAEVARKAEEEKRRLEIEAFLEEERLAQEAAAEEEAARRAEEEAAAKQAEEARLALQAAEAAQKAEEEAAAKKAEEERLAFEVAEAARKAAEEASGEEG